MKSTSYWLSNRKKVERAAVKYLALYARSAAAHPGMRLPRDFSGRALAALPRYTGYLPFHPGGSGNFFNQLMPVLAVMAAVHSVLRSGGWTVDQIARLNYEMFHADFRRLPGPARGLMRIFMVSSLFSRLMRRPCRAMRGSGREDTFDIAYSFSKEGGKRTAMSCSRCGMISFMKRADMTEMFAYCNIFDFAQADAIGLGLVQPSCIGSGDPVCEYRFTPDAADTRYPAALRRILATNMEM